MVECCKIKVPLFDDKSHSSINIPRESHGSQIPLFSPNPNPFKPPSMQQFISANLCQKNSRSRSWVSDSLVQSQPQPLQNTVCATIHFSQPLPKKFTLTYSTLRAELVRVAAILAPNAPFIEQFGRTYVLITRGNGFEPLF